MEVSLSKTGGKWSVQKNVYFNVNENFISNINVNSAADEEIQAMSKHKSRDEQLFEAAGEPHDNARITSNAEEGAKKKKKKENTGKRNT